MKLVHNVLAPLASLKVQKRYVIEATGDEYLLPGELLEIATNVLFEQRALKFEETRALAELKKAIRACHIPEGMSNSDFVLAYEPWVRVREASQKYLAEIGFDLPAWEEHEL